jgi:CheY-like chemotaxis protein
MQSQDIYSDAYPIGRRTNHILIIDDNPQLRSLFARHILIASSDKNRSCALYHVTEKAQARLTFFEPHLTLASNPELDFAVYEANSPRQALNWLRQVSFKRLVIVSDVMMPIDTEVGLDGLLDGLAQLYLEVSMLFVSSEPQSKSLVKALMAPQQAYFVIKGSDNWSKLPAALVQNMDSMPYRLVQREPVAVVAPVKTPDIPISSPTNSHTDSYTLNTVHPQPNPEYAAPIKMQKAVNPTIQLEPAPITNNRMHSASSAASYAATPNKPGLWSRLLHFLRG